jgi:single-strand selective monofunctional uracil DNA glycosylase
MANCTGDQQEVSKMKEDFLVPEKLIAAASLLNKRLKRVDFSHAPPWIYNPLDYAWEAHRQYLTNFARPSCEILLLGMNPGPWGMSQTGVPFGEVSQVKEWLKIDAKIGKPKREHPKRLVEGLNCPRQEISGQRFWGLFRQRFVEPDKFFEKHFVVSYCPLAFMAESGLNVTPDKLPASVRDPLEKNCDEHLAEVLRVLQPKWIIGVGAWAEKCASRVVKRVEREIRVGRILHPSPASPAANRDWSSEVVKQFNNLGVWRQ